MHHSQRGWFQPRMYQSWAKRSKHLAFHCQITIHSRMFWTRYVFSIISQGAAFRRQSHELFTCSTDRSVKVWTLDEMAYIETVFGHRDNIQAIDAMTKERAITAGGRDNSIRVWKIVEESQFVFDSKAWVLCWNAYTWTKLKCEILLKKKTPD